ncbi:MAG: hypothetical protein AAF355_11545 [Myxococcota bacterium]
MTQVSPFYFLIPGGSLIACGIWLMKRRYYEVGGLLEGPHSGPYHRDFVGQPIPSPEQMHPYCC